MTTAERIHLLRRHGLENTVIAAVIGADVVDVAAHIADPSVEVDLGGGGAVDVTGLLPLDGSRAMTGLLDFGSGVTVGAEDTYFGIHAGGMTFFAGDGGGGIFATPDDSYTTYAGFYASGAADFVVNPGGRALSIDQVGSSASSLHIDADGSVHWGDGTAAPDVSMERGNGDPGELFVTSPTSSTNFVVGNGDAAGRWSRTNIDVYVNDAGSSITWSDLLGGAALFIDSRMPNESYEGSRGGLVMMSDNRYLFDLQRTGEMAWYAPTGPDSIDVTLGRDSYAGALRLGAPAYVGEIDFNMQVEGQSEGIGFGSYAGGAYMSMSGPTDGIYEVGFRDTHIIRQSPGLLLIDTNTNEHPTGILAWSPDGTKYKLTPPNGGGAATWVAA